MCIACSTGELRRIATLCRDHYNQYHREYSKRNAERTRERHRISRVKRYAESIEERIRTKANAAVWYALKTGKMQRKSCEVCGDDRTEAHHDSYKREDFLRVKFLCVRHHAETHRNMTPIYD